MSDQNVNFLPVGIEPPSPDEELALEDAAADVGFAGVELVRAPPPPLGRTPAYDFVEKAFVPSVSGGALMLYGEATLRQWVEKCLRTIRGASPAVDPDFGVERRPEDLIDGGAIDPAEHAAAEADWTTALLRHPRINRVEGWAVDVQDEGEVVEVTARITAEGLGPEDTLEPIDIALRLGGLNG
jgi:phage baseplate assembly protein W